MTRIGGLTGDCVAVCNGEGDQIMYPNNLPLEHLAVFAIVFVTGFISVVGFGKYMKK